MGWKDISQQTEYAKQNLVERDKIRKKYKQEFSDEYSDAELEDILHKNNAYDLEKNSVSGKETGLFSGGRGAVKTGETVSGEPMPFRPDWQENKYKSEDQLAKEALVPFNPPSQEALDILAKEQQLYPSSPFIKGFRDSPLGAMDMSTIPEEKRAAVQAALQRSNSAYADFQKRKNYGEQVIDSASEGVGNMVGSPSTYVTGIAGKAIQPAGRLVKAAVFPATSGAMQGAEEIQSRQNAGEDIGIAQGAKIVGKNILMNYLPSRFAESAGSGLKRVVSDNAAKIMSVPTKAAVFGATQTVGETGSALIDKATGRDDRSVKDIFSDSAKGTLANAITSLPITARNLSAERLTKQINKPVKKTAITDMLEADRLRQSFVYANAPEIKKSSAPLDMKAYQDAIKALDPQKKQTESYVKNTPGKTWKALFATTGELFGETKIKSLSTIAGWAKDEKAKLYSKMENDALTANPDLDRKMFKRQFEDDYNKGKIQSPAAVELKRLIMAEPTENQTAIHDANETLGKIYDSLKPEESALLDNYLTMKNLSEARKRALGRGETYTLPEGVTPEVMNRIIDGVEGDKSKANLLDRAKQTWALYKGVLQRDYANGLIDQQTFNDLNTGNYYVPIEHIADPSPYREKNIKVKNSGDSGDYKHLSGGSRKAINLNAGQILHSSLVKSRMNELKHERLSILYNMAAENKYGMKLGEPGVGEDSITYKKDGEKVDIVVPDWFKKSLENNGFEGNQKILNVLGILTGTTPLKKAAVQWNPEFAESNYFRDFGRYYRLQAIASDPTHSIARRFFVDNNPAVYTAQMLKAQKDVATNFAEWKELAMRNNALRGRMTMDYEGDRYAGKIEKGKRAVDEFAGYLGSASEDLMRLASFKMLIDKGFTPKRAGEITGEFLDYNRKGTASGVMDKVVPFFNVAIQAPRADYKVLRARPADYGMRMGWNAMKYAALASVGYALTGGEADDQTIARDRANSMRYAIPSKNSDGSYTQISIPIDQQDRFIAALGDSLARYAIGKPIDTERLGMTFKDFLSVPLPGNQYVAPTVKAGMALSGDLTKDLYTGRKISMMPEAMDGNRWMNTDGSETDQATILARAFHDAGIADVQPAAIDYAAKTIFPVGFAQNAANFLISSAQGDPDFRKIPMVRKIVRKTNQRLPEQTAAEEGAVLKQTDTIRNFQERKGFDKISDPDKYMNAVLRRADSIDDPKEQRRLYNMAKQGYKDRLEGISATDKYYRNKVDPSKYAEINRLRKKTGRDTFNDQSWYIKQRAREQENYDGSEQ